MEFDFPGLEIGVAEYEEGPTGCTVFHLPKLASLSIDVRGGLPGVNGQHLDAINAICFAGGSLYGLEASTGVAAELFKMRGYSTNWMDIALVSGAIIFDFGPRSNAIYPDKELGRAAVRAMLPGRFPLGARGAGRSATAGHGAGAELAGQGGAYPRIGADESPRLRRGQRVRLHRRPLRQDRAQKTDRPGAGARATVCEHDAVARRDEPEARPPAAAVHRAPGPHLDGAGHTPVPLSLGRRCQLHGVYARGRER